MSDEIQGRLQFMAFSQAQRDLLAGMRGLLAQLIPGALDKFYDKVRQTPETKRFFRDGEHMRSAHAAQEKHWARIAEGKFEFVMNNFAPPDMVGHTGVYEAAVEGVSETDKAIGKVYEACKANGYTLFITSDHG